MTDSRNIAAVQALEILDSRGNPTVRAEVILEDGTAGAACVPSGASTGRFEAHELRDNVTSRYGGRGVTAAVHAIETVLAPALLGMNVDDGCAVDRRLCEADGTENKHRLGANALLAVSLAAARARAIAHGLPLWRELGGERARRLPCPLMNILNGGAHAANNVDIQEFMIVPVGLPNFAEALRAGSEIYHALGSLLKQRGLACGVGDEGGFAPMLRSDEEALDLLCEAVTAAGYTTDEVRLAVDAAASEWVTEDGRYRLPKRGTELCSDELIAYWERLAAQYPLFSVEDGLGEEDWDGFERMTERLGPRLQLVGDDLFVTNPQRIDSGIRRRAANAVLIKPNQIGTLTETLRAIETAQCAGYGVIISHRSGETEDPLIADLAVAVGAGQIKAGAPCRSDRTAKYNRLLAIERSLGEDALYGIGRHTVD